MTYPARYTCLCPSCGQDFGSTSAFDHHRVGSHEFVLAPTDLATEGGRRCLGRDEMRAKGMHQDSRGRWRRGGETPNPHATRQTREPTLWSTSRAAA